MESWIQPVGAILEATGIGYGISESCATLLVKLTPSDAP
jgi:hypothetical protein